MIHKIDWISYTYQTEGIHPESMYRLRDILVDRMPDYINTDFISYDTAPRRKGFRVGVAIGDHTYAYINQAGLVLIEHTGKACSLLEAEGLIEIIVTNNADALTRIDIATDIYSEWLGPRAFVDAMESKKASAGAEVFSASGHTIYVGSKKSDRYCRVYKYTAPHPRANFLRIEYVYRKEQAKIIGHALKTATVAQIANGCAERYKWSPMFYHPDEKDTAVVLGAWRPERRQGKTARWLLAQAAPSLARMIADGELTLDEFIEAVKEHSVKAGYDAKLL